VQARKIGIRHKGHALVDAELAELSLEFTENIKAVNRSKKRLQKLLKAVRKPTTRQQKLEEELLRRWLAREHRDHDSQLKLAELFVQLTRVNMLDQMLVGHFNNVEVGY